MDGRRCWKTGRVLDGWKGAGWKSVDVLKGLKGSKRVTILRGFRRVVKLVGFKLLSKSWTEKRNNAQKRTKKGQKHMIDS